MEYLEKIIAHVKPRTQRSYRGGIELRGIDLDSAKVEIKQLIAENSWPVEVFHIDARLRSIAIREIK